MATLRRGLVDTVKKAASKVSARGVQVAAKAGTRGARVLVETTVAAVKTVDKLQEKLGRGSSKAKFTEKARESAPRRTSAAQASEATPVEPRDSGRKTMPTVAAAPKRSKKGKRGQKHRHSGR